jgi:hypothetical protein
MSWLDRLFARKRLHADLREEVESYIAERTEALIDHGIAPAEAARQARLHFGNPSLTVEHGVEAWQFRWLASLWADFRFALHQLRKSPGYAITAVLTLAIGIGANAAIFTVLDDAMLRSLPVHDPSQLVTLGFQSSSAQNRYTPVQFGAGLPVLDKLRSLSGISGWEGSMVTFPDDQNTLRSFGADVVTGNALSLLDVHPMLGRLLTQADDSGSRISTEIQASSVVESRSPVSLRLSSEYFHITSTASMSVSRKDSFCPCTSSPRSRPRLSRIPISIRRVWRSRRSHASLPAAHLPVSKLSWPR